MKEDDINIDRDIENLVKAVQRNGFGYIMADVFEQNAFNRFAKEKMLSYGLIKIGEKPQLYHLTERGWNFKSFADEDAQEEFKRRLLKINVENAERINKTYWITFCMAVFSFIVSIVLLILRLTESKAPHN